MLLTINDLETGYDKKQVLFGIDLSVNTGEIVALIGPNGCGKSTVLKAIIGIVPSWKGKIYFDALQIQSFNPHKRISLGISYCPQGNRVFSDLNVRENLELGGLGLKKEERCKRIREIFFLFPKLNERSKQLAGTLSGGEQQMVAVGRALISQPKLLLLDEPSLGLTPEVLNEMFEALKQINFRYGVSILVIEQKVREVLNLCNKVYSLKMGKVSYVGQPTSLLLDTKILKSLFL